MIVLMGILANEVMAYLCWKLTSMNVEFVVLDARVFRTDFHLDWGVGPCGLEGSLRYAERCIDLRRVQSIYMQSIELGSPSPGMDARASHEAAMEIQVSLTAFVDGVPLLVANRPSACTSNGSKTYQQQIIGKYGFATPRTLITTEPEEALAFYEECGGRVIYKSLSHVRSIVQRLTDADLPRLQQVRCCPTQFQEFIPGVEVRVHVVGERVFATEISTEAVDYRYAGREGVERRMRPFELPDEVAERCIRLTQGLEMTLTGIDLRRSTDEEYYCWEVNPTPGFTFFQRYTGQRIGEALVDLLRHGNGTAI